MNKYTLTFKNNSIEEQYQKNCIGMIRMNMFKLIIVSQIIVYAVRVGQAAIQKNYIYTVLSLAMIIYLVIQYYITKKYQKLLRSSIIMVNHVFTIYLLLIEDSNDPYSSYLRGVNQMGSNLFMMLAGEFIDALFSLISIQIIRIIIVFIKSSSIEYYAIFAVFVILTYASKQLHMYHKALRSQFFLTLKEKQWQNIFDQIIQDIPYLLLTFDEEELKFMVSTIKNCGEFLPNNKIALQFLRFSNNQGQSLEQIIYKEISNYKQQKQEVFNRKLCVYQDRRQFLIEYSIFYGNQPSVLIKFKDLKQISNNYQRDDQINHSKSSLEYYCFSLKFIQKLLIVEDKTYFLRQVRKKFVILKMIDEIQTSTFVPKRINFNQILGQIKKFYPLIKINFIIDSDIQIYSIPSLINLFLISTLETLESNHIGIYQRSQFNEYLEFHFTDSLKIYEQIQSDYCQSKNTKTFNFLQIIPNSICSFLFMMISFREILNYDETDIIIIQLNFYSIEYKIYMRVNDFFRLFLLMGNCYKPQPKLEVPDIGQMQEIPTNEQSRLIEENNRLVMIYSELLEKMKNLEDENSSLYYSLQQNKKLLDENNNIITNLLEENSKLQDKNKTLSDQISIRKQILAQKEQEIQRFKKGIEHEKNIFSSNTEQIRDINEVVTANTSIKSEKIDISDNSDKKNICDINIKDQRDRAVIQFQSINEKKNQNNNATIKENVQGENNHNIAQQFEA